MSNIQIVNTNDMYDFSKINLGNPVQTNNNMFFSKISDNKDIYIQTPEITCKDGFIKNSKKPYIDLLFDQSHENFVEFIENLEQTVKQLIYDKRSEWFQDSNVDITDIDNIFISPFRTYKSGKKLILRVYLESPKSMINKKELEIYDENENELSSDDITTDSVFIALLHINGLRFSSKTFQIYIDVKQIMIINEKINEKLLIKKSNTNDEPHIDNDQPHIDNDKSNDEIISSKEISENEEKNPEVESSEMIEYGETELINSINCNNSNDIDNINDNNEEKTINDTHVSSLQEIDSINNNDNSVDKKIHLHNENKSHDENIDIKEFDLNLETLEDDNIKINKPSSNQIKEYKEALAKAKIAQKKALELHLQAKNIKAQYLLNINSDSDSDSD